MPNRIGERDISYTNFTCVLQLNSLALSGKKTVSPNQEGNSVSIFNFVKAPPSKFAETQANKALLFEIEKSKWVSILSDSGLKRLKGPNMSKHKHARNFPQTRPWERTVQGSKLQQLSSESVTGCFFVGFGCRLKF